MAEEARLESVCTPKGYREFESRSLRKNDSQPAAKAASCFRHTADASSLVDDVWRKQTRGPSGPTAVSSIFARTPREGTEIAAAPRPPESRSKSNVKNLPILPDNLLRRHTQRLVELLSERPHKRLLQELIHPDSLSPPLFKGASANIPAR